MILDEGFNNLSRKQTEKKCIAESTKTRSNKTAKDWKKTTSRKHWCVENTIAMSAHARTRTRPSASLPLPLLTLSSRTRSVRMSHWYLTRKKTREWWFHSITIVDAIKNKDLEHPPNSYDKRGKEKKVGQQSHWLVSSYATNIRISTCKKQTILSSIPIFQHGHFFIDQVGARSLP